MECFRELPLNYIIGRISKITTSSKNLSEPITMYIFYITYNISCTNKLTEWLIYQKSHVFRIGHWNNFCPWNINSNCKENEVNHSFSIHTFPFFWNLKIFSVTACGIVGGNVWRVKREGIHNICINRTIKSMHLPVWRNCMKQLNHLQTRLSREFLQYETKNDWWTDEKPKAQ